MGTIWVKEFIGGLDTRKLAETTPGGVLIEATDCHITRGGEIEKRAAFVKAYSLPAGQTKGLAYSTTSLTVFGSVAPPTMPVGVAYQQLQHPDLSTAIVDENSFDLYKGKIYVAATFADGSIQHFYDGNRVTTWYDGRARAAFTITAGAAATFAEGSLTVIAGTAGSLDDLKVGGVSIITSPVAAGTDEADTAQLIADEVNALGYFSAEAVGPVVTLTAPTAGSAFNGQAITAVESGGLDVGSFVSMAGGVNASTLTQILVGGTDVLGAPVLWPGSATAMAAAIAGQVNTAVSAPDYVAVSSGATVTVISVAGGTVANGRPVIFGVFNGLVISPASTALAGGADAQDQADAIAATSQFKVVASAPGVEATATLAINSTASDETLTVLTVSGVALIPGTQNYPAAMTSPQIATSLAGVIAALSGTSGYTASADDDVVTVTGVLKGATPNGVVPVLATTGGLDITPTAFAGGSDGGRLKTFTIGGVSVIPAGVIEGNADPATMAAAIASAVNSHTSSPDYVATALADQLTITASVAGSAANNRTLVFTKGAALVFSPAAPPVMNGGADAVVGTFQPGDFVRTIGTKMYSEAGSNLHFSGIRAPTKWTADTTGAGFIDMAAEASGAEQLTSLAKYQDLVAVFAQKVVMLWYLDPDPTLNKISQVLANTGTSSPRSVTQFGDSDIFYAEISGVRSLRARQNVNSAATSDVGVAVDTLLSALLATLSADELKDVIGIIEPRDKRFWLAVQDQIFVYSFFADGKVSAWTTYQLPFVVQDMVPFQNKVWVRSGDDIYVYGGTGDTITYDTTEAIVRLPMLDANKPTEGKEWTGIDAAIRGAWEVRAFMNVADQAASDVVANIYETTYGSPRIPLEHRSSHIGLRLQSKGGGEAKLGSVVIHYRGNDDEDSGS